MNFLVHLFLSGNDNDLLVGNLLGDFVKGRLEGRYPGPIERGIELHRRVDSFCAGNRYFLMSKRRIDPSFGHYRGVLVDLFYDHFLARNWAEHSEIPFPRFICETRRVMEDYRNYLPERLRALIPFIFSDLLPSYLEIEGISRALARMSKRIKRDNRLGEGGEELKSHYLALHGDFTIFFPELRQFAREWQGRLPDSGANERL
jgi:acyl carrier protein phosphodiesterase